MFVCVSMHLPLYVLRSLGASVMEGSHRLSPPHLRAARDDCRTASGFEGAFDCGCDCERGLLLVLGDWLQEGRQRDTGLGVDVRVVRHTRVGAAACRDLREQRP